MKGSWLKWVALTGHSPFHVHIHELLKDRANSDRAVTGAICSALTQARRNRAPKADDAAEIAIANKVMELVDCLLANTLPHAAQHHAERWQAELKRLEAALAVDKALYKKYLKQEGLI